MVGSTRVLLGASGFRPPTSQSTQQLRDGRCGTVLPKRIAHSGNELVAQLLSELHTPLIEGIDAPDHALHENLVLIKGDEAPQRRGIEVGKSKDRARAA